ncbi:hypothetical protein MMC22_000995 [Lobaria immixta]|nr:hypothetical protein [Lobaria immixta]
MISRYRNYVLLNDEKEVVERPSDTGRNMDSKSGGTGCIAVLAALLFSLVLNAFFIVQRLSILREGAAIENSVYAHLASDSTLAWTSKSPYFGEDEVEADLLWERISIDNGTVALSDSYVESMGLPTSQRFPWDQNKGLYLLNGFHGMHCLKTIRQAVLEFDRGLNQSEPTHHILHCLDSLRQDLLCYADDTPRYTGFQPSGRSGTGQFRQCRNWSRLEAWAQENTACWRYTHPHDETIDLLERHKFCPEGSPYIARVKEVFGDV